MDDFLVDGVNTHILFSTIQFYNWFRVPSEFNMDVADTSNASCMKMLDKSVFTVAKKPFLYIISPCVYFSNPLAHKIHHMNVA